MEIRKISLILAISLSLLACSESPELLENNDPSKYSVEKDLLWASPDGFDLTMDIYTPNSGKESYPVLIIYHGGGWLINDKSIMNQMSSYLATNSEYVVCNVNYRLLVDQGNTVTFNEIVEDVFGAVLWVKENISKYQGDSSRLAVTGDSAGGHLAAMVVNRGNQLSSAGFSAGELSFKPSYLPKGKTAEDIVLEDGIKVQAAILSYGGFDIYAGCLDGFERMSNIFWAFGGSWSRGIFGDEFSVEVNPEMYKAVSPNLNIPDSSYRKLPPQLLTIGSDDSLIDPEDVKTYLNQLHAAGHPAEYWEYEGKQHAFLDSGSNSLVGQSFEEDAPLALNIMIDFLDSVFYE